MFRDPTRRRMIISRPGGRLPGCPRSHSEAPSGRPLPVTVTAARASLPLGVTPAAARKAAPGGHRHGHAPAGPVTAARAECRIANLNASTTSTVSHWPGRRLTRDSARLGLGGRPPGGVMQAAPASESLPFTGKSESSLWPAAAGHWQPEAHRGTVTPAVPDMDNLNSLCLYE